MRRRVIEVLRFGFFKCDTPDTRYIAELDCGHFVANIRERPVRINLNCPHCDGKEGEDASRTKEAR